MKLIKKNILGFIIESIVFGSIGITIASQILATQVSYSNTKSEANVTNVDGALTELYDIALDCINNSNNENIKEYKGSAAEAIYLDPTGTENDCSESKYASDTETKEGCMKFWVYAEDSEYKYAILDHNTTVEISSCTNNNCFAIAQAQVKQDTSTWNPNLQARNISAMEVYKITESTNNKPNWQIKEGNSFWFSGSSSTKGQGYGWLFDRTYECIDYGCATSDNNVSGYWTSNVYDSSNAWRMANLGNFGYDSLDYPFYGVRPVIQIAK